MAPIHRATSNKQPPIKFNHQPMNQILKNVSMPLGHTHTVTLLTQQYGIPISYPVNHPSQILVVSPNGQHAIT